MVQFGYLVVQFGHEPICKKYPEEHAVHADSEHSIQLKNRELHELHVPFNMKNPMVQLKHDEKLHVMQLENLNIHGTHIP